MSFCAQFAPVREIISGNRPPKGDFMDILSIDCHVQLISITTITTAFVNSGNFALAQSRTGPSASANLNDVKNNNIITKQYLLNNQDNKNNNKICHHCHQFLDNHKKSMNIH